MQCDTMEVLIAGRVSALVCWKAVLPSARSDACSRQVQWNESLLMGLLYYGT